MTPFEKMESALRQWHCPSCGGSGVYQQRTPTDHGEVPCKVCRGIGLHPLAADALGLDEQVLATSRAKLVALLTDVVDAYDQRFGTPLGNFAGPIDDEIRAARDALAPLRPPKSPAQGSRRRRET